MTERSNRAMLRFQGNADEETRLSDIINFLHKETLLASRFPPYYEALGSIMIPSKKRSMPEEDFRTMFHTQKIQGRIPRKSKEVFSAPWWKIHDLDDCKQLQLNKETKICKRINYVWLAIYQRQNTIMQGNSGILELAKYVSRNTWLPCIGMWQAKGSSTKHVSSEELEKVSVGDNGDKINKMVDFLFASTFIVSKVIKMCIIPMKLSHSETKKWISTYVISKTVVEVGKI